MKQKIEKHHLDTERTIPYFIDHIECGKILSQAIVKKIKFELGDFYTYLPFNAHLNKIYNFSCGGIVPSVPYGTCTYNIEGVSEHFHPQKIITMDEECSKFIYNYTRKNEQNYAVIENYMLKPENPHTQINNVKMLSFEEEVYYFLDKRNSVEEVYRTIRSSKEIWHTLFVLTQIDPPITLDKQAIDRICENAELVIAGAYDGEGYIFWQKFPEYCEG